MAARTADKVERPELLSASDETIEDAVSLADVMLLRGLIYQLTGDPEIAATETRRARVSIGEAMVPASDSDIALIRRKAVQFLKAYRDAGAGPIELGPEDRLAKSLDLASGVNLPERLREQFIEELAFDPWVRALNWTKQPTEEQLAGFTVAVIGTGMGGLNAALHLKRAGINYTVLEKNDGVGGTWWENRYPGARVDTPNRAYSHLYGANYRFPYPFCPQSESLKYFNWIADTFDLRDSIQFNTEVKTLTWNEAEGLWEILAVGPDGEKTLRCNAVITAVGFLSQPNIPDFEGRDTFKGLSWHTSRWPEDIDLTEKRVAVIGTGATGYQMIPELALQTKHITVFQRRASWVEPTPGYCSPFPPQIDWLDRNLPFFTNFARLRTFFRGGFAGIVEIDPDFKDPHSISPGSKAARDTCIAFLESKIKDPALVAAMTPDYPVWGARVIRADPEYSIVDAIQRDDVDLVTDEIRRISPTGIETVDGKLHEVDVIVFATGFHATEYLYPMTITGRNGLTTEEAWQEEGARGYYGAMIPGFPNLWTIYGPNTNGGLNVAGYHEMITLFALKGIEKLILEGKKSVEVREEPFREYNERLDALNLQRVWADPRAHSYYWTKFGRSATMNPMPTDEIWSTLRDPVWDHLIVD